MRQTIDSILNDLYMIDKSLKQHEGELKKILEEMLAQRPEVKLSAEFVSELKQELLRKADEIKQSHQPETQEKYGFKYFTWSRFAFAAGGATIAILLMLPLLNTGQPSSLNKSTNLLKLAMDTGIIDAGRDAFGSLVQNQNDKAGIETSLSAPVADRAGNQEESSINPVDGSSPVATFGKAIGLGGGGGGAPMMDSRIAMPPFELIQYSYAYKGGGFNVPDSSLDVYRQVTRNETGSSLAGLLSSVGLDAVDLSKFKNQKVSNFSINEDREFGYMVSFDLINNLVSIYQNWEKWPQPGTECQDQACWDKYRLALSDLPADEELITIADSFLNSYGVATGNLGQGEVINYWLGDYERASAEEKTNFYVPDTVSVTYPYLIDGLKVYDEGGYPSGVNVDINIRYDRVAGAYGITYANYEKSAYVTETDTDKILKVAERGGRYAYLDYYGDEAEKIEIELGEPELVLARWWQYSDKLTQNETLFVPAFLFPVKGPDDLPGNMDHGVVVPLVKEILDEINTDEPNLPVPRPLMREEMPMPVDNVIMEAPASLPANGDETQVQPE